MGLTVDEIRKVLVEGRNRKTLQKAKRHESRLRFHSETTLSEGETANSSEFFSWIETILPPDKYKVFKTLFRYPVKTVTTTDKIYSALEKVFEGANPVFQYEFNNPEDKQDWEAYRNGTLKEATAWKTKGFDRMKSGINSVLIVDLPEEQSGSLPEPYFYFLDTCDVIDFDHTEGTFEWIAFKQPGEKIAFFDDESFRVFNTNDTSKISAGTLQSEQGHDLGFCPACWFWTTPISYKDPNLKLSPLSAWLSDLDWLLYFLISKRHLDTYASYPIYSTYEEDCNYTAHDETAGAISCHRGYLQTEDLNYLRTVSGQLQTCPICSKNKLAGAGSLIEVPVPDEENGFDLNRNPVQIIEISRSSLDYNVDETKRLESEIYAGVTGFGGEMNKNQAINEKQVIASFEARKNVLFHIASNFEAAQKWTTETICKLRYGTRFEFASISYGTEFFLMSAEEILQMYKEAKKSGLSDDVLDMLQDQYNQTKYRNNPEQLTRINILNHLDLFRHLSKGEVSGMFAAGNISYSDYYIKVNFSSLIMRFERENIGIVAFGSSLEFDEKIETIQEVLRGYVPQIQQTPEPTPE